MSKLRATRWTGCLLAGLLVEPPCVPEWTRPNWQSFWVRLPESCDRSELMQQMFDAGIATRRGILCAHREPAYAAEPWLSGAGGLAMSERAQDRSLLLPLFHQMTEAEQDRVVSALGAALSAPACRAKNSPRRTGGAT